jgi:hypothetical protein
MNKKSILHYFIAPIALCSALLAISYKIESSEFLIGLSVFTWALLLVNLILIAYFKKNKLGLKVLPVTIGLLLWFISIIVISLIDNNKSLEDEIIDKLEAFNKKNGRYPYCSTTSDLFDSLSINLNYYSPDDYKYEFNKKENSCTFKYLNDSIIYDSKNRIKVKK